MAKTELPIDLRINLSSVVTGDTGLFCSVSALIISARPVTMLIPGKYYKRRHGLKMERRHGRQNFTFDKVMKCRKRRKVGCRLRPAV